MRTEPPVSVPRPAGASLAPIAALARLDLAKLPRGTTAFFLGTAKLFFQRMKLLAEVFQLLAGGGFVLGKADAGQQASEQQGDERHT